MEVGGELRFYKDTTPLGRIAAQMAKQVIFQKVREAERDTVFHEYNHRAGEVLNATVKRLEPMDVIFDLGKAEARMPKREQSRLEQFAVGERVRVVLLRVDRAAKGPQVIVSRAAPALVQNLFQSEVPEIYDGTVTIRAIAREAGERTKIAVMSRDKDVDPVGACVGMKGMRVQSIIRELRGEKIDIIEYSEEITTFAEKALQPAKVSRVSIVDLAEKQIEVIVDDTQLSLAIGKKGQNVRLAAKLLGWKIDIKSEEEKRQEVEQQMHGDGRRTDDSDRAGDGAGRADPGEADRGRHHDGRGAGGHDAGAAGRGSGHRREDAREDFDGGAALLRPVRRGRGAAGSARRLPRRADAGERADVASKADRSDGADAAEDGIRADEGTGEDEGDAMDDKTPEEMLAEEAAELARRGVERRLDRGSCGCRRRGSSLSDANDDADAREEQIELRNDAIDDLVDQARRSPTRGSTRTGMTVASAGGGRGGSGRSSK